MGPDKRVQSLFDCFQNTTESDVLGLKKKNERNTQRTRPNPSFERKKELFWQLVTATIFIPFNLKIFFFRPVPPVAPCLG